MLVHSSEKIFLQSWRSHSQWLKGYYHEHCIVTDANILPGIHVSFKGVTSVVCLQGSQQVYD